MSTHTHVISFTKSHGLGNDFILVDFRQRPIPTSLLSAKVIRYLCDRHRGIGADGVIFLQKSHTATASLRIFNSDGSEAESCGNGWRCAAKFIWEHPLDDFPKTQRTEENKGSISIETIVKTLPCTLGVDPLSNRVTWVEVEMGAPSFLRKDLPMTGPKDEEATEERVFSSGKEFLIHPVSMGNPHAVVFLEDPNQSCFSLAKKYGPEIEENPRFPSRVNVSFARRMGPQNLELAVWERGAGLTQACGTGACATVVSACREGLFPLGERVTVHLPGGELEIRVLPKYQNVLMRGPAVEVFSGEISIQSE